MVILNPSQCHWFGHGIAISLYPALYIQACSVPKRSSWKKASTASKSLGSWRGQIPHKSPSKITFGDHLGSSRICDTNICNTTLLGPSGFCYQASLLWSHLCLCQNTSDMKISFSAREAPKLSAPPEALKGSVPIRGGWKAIILSGMDSRLSQIMVRTVNYYIYSAYSYIIYIYQYIYI